MSQTETKNSNTQHAMLAALGEFASQLGLIQQLTALKLHQKHYQHSPQSKILEFLVATLGGLEHLKEISRSAHPLDQDRVVAEAWRQPNWADYSGVSRTLKALNWSEVDQIIQVLEKTSQIFITSETNLALLFEGHLIYDGDLTGLAVSKSSTTYPGVAFGHMDDQVRLGYQAAVVSLRSPTYQRLWLSVDHHAGNMVSASAAQGMILAAEARTGVRPMRRTELVGERLQAVRDYGLVLQHKLIERQQKAAHAFKELEQVDQKLVDCQACVNALALEYQARQRLERPCSQLAEARKKLITFQKRQVLRANALTKAQQIVEWTKGLILKQQAEQNMLQERLERFRQDNTSNPRPIQAVFRLDAGFGTYENLALLIEMGYEVYTKLPSRMVLQNLLKQVPPEADWTPVGTQASMFAWKKHQMENFYYPLEVGLERFTDGDRVKYCALLHYGSSSLCQDLPSWFNFYSDRQTIEAGIKESKQVFHLNRLKVRSEPAIYLQENFVLFAANFVRWASTWLSEGNDSEILNVERLGVKDWVHVAAHTSAEVIWNSNVKLLRFSAHSIFAGKKLKLPIFTYQLPLPLGKSYDFADV